MSDPIVYGFPRSTFVNIVRLLLTHKDVAYEFQDLEPVMGKPGPCYPRMFRKLC